MQLYLPLSLAALASVASASILHVIPGTFQPRSEHVPTRSHSLIRRAHPSTAAQFASLNNPQQECKPYGIDALTAMQQQKEFPEDWKVAHIIDNDTDAQQIWKEIQDSGIIPSDVQVKTADNSTGAFMGVKQSGYDDNSDPDCWWTSTGCMTPKHKGLDMDLSTCPEPDTWGLSFDDGPNCTHNAFYDFLSQNNLKATMFYIGSNVLDNPLQAQRGIVDGHDICVHTWSHHYTTTLTNEEVFAELYYTAKVIKKVVGVTPTCWRAPYGDVDDRVRAIASGLGLRTILWEEDTNDWDIVPSGSDSTQQIDQNYENIFNKAGSESPIVLTHEIVLQTMEEFQKMYPQLKKAYKNVVPLSACQNVTQVYPDSNISYPTFSEFVGGNVNASGLPDGNTIQVDSSAKFSPKSLNNTQIGFGHPQSAVAASKSSSAGSSSSQSKNASSSQSSSKAKSAGSKSSDQNKNAESGAKGLMVSLPLTTVVAATAAFALLALS